MRLSPLSLALWSLCAVGTADALTPSAGRGGVVPPRGAEGTSVLLYDQTDNAASNGVPDQDFEPAFDIYDAEAADDFVVPAGTSWTVDQVRTVGTTGTAGGAKVNVIFYANSAGGGDPDLPGAAVPGCSYSSLQPVDTAGSFTVSLPTACNLPAGTYWVSVQAIQSFASNGQHFWSNRSVQTGSESVWRNPGGGFATTVPCTSFRPQTACGVGGGVSPDLLFQVWGTQVSTAAPVAAPSMDRYGLVLMGLLLAAVAGFSLTRRDA